MKKLLLIALLLPLGVVSCTTKKKANYKIEGGETKVYKLSRDGITKDILSNGDTLVSTGSDIYIIKKKP